MVTSSSFLVGYVTDLEPTNGKKEDTSSVAISYLAELVEQDEAEIDQIQHYHRRQNFSMMIVNNAVLRQNENLPRDS